MTVEGSAKSRVPNLSFCSISLSPPSWLEPNTTTRALLPSLALARFANSFADESNNEPGSPTWPNLSSICASAGGHRPTRKTRRARRTDSMLFSFLESDVPLPEACCPTRDANVAANAKARFSTSPRKRPSLEVSQPHKKAVARLHHERQRRDVTYQSVRPEHRQVAPPSAE